MHFRDPFNPRDPPEPREHYEDCPVSAIDGTPDRDCTCAEVDAIAYDDAMERRGDALRDRDD